MVNSRDDAWDIAKAIGVGVFEARWVDLIYGCIVPPMACRLRCTVWHFDDSMEEMRGGGYVREMLLGNTYMEATLIYSSVHALGGDQTVDLILLLVAERFGNIVSYFEYVPSMVEYLAGEWRNHVSLKPFHRHVRATDGFAERPSTFHLSSSVTALKMTSRNAVAKLPCDACRRRKVRCDYRRPCDRCQSYNLECTFDSVRKKRGPKKGKGAVVQQLRAESRSKTTSRPESASGTSVQSSATDVQQDSSTHEQWQDGIEISQHREMPPASAPAYSPYYTETHASANSGVSSNAYTSTPAEAFGQINATDPGFMNDDYLITFDEFAHVILGSSSQLPAHVNIPQATSSPAQFADLFSNVHSGTIPPTPTQNPSFELNSITKRSIDLFFSHLYPIYPILDEGAIRSSLSNHSELDSASNCMLLSMCAMTLVHVDKWPSMSTEQRAVHARKCVRQCQEIRMNTNFIENATFEDILCSLFIAVTYFELKCRKASWFFVREAITLAHATGLHLASQDASSNATEQIQKQRTYAILFITERGAAVLDSFPVTILSPPTLSCDMFLDEDPSVSRGLSSLHSLFSLLNFDFVQLWNELASLTGGERGFPELSRLQVHLRQDLGIQGLSDIQRADVLITQQWLRLVFWQAALRLGLISSSAADSAFTYHYPVEIASSLCEIVKSLPPVAIQVHGLGIVSIHTTPASTSVNTSSSSKSNSR